MNPSRFSRKPRPEEKVGEWRARIDAGSTVQGDEGTIASRAVPGVDLCPFEEGAARVTASMDMKDNDYGKGFGAFVAVTLACTNEGVPAAYEAAVAFVAEKVHDVHARAAKVYAELHP